MPEGSFSPFPFKQNCSNFISCEFFFRNKGSNYFLTVLLFSSSNRPLILERHIKMIKESEAIMRQATGGEQWKTYMTIVGLCQMGHNNFCVSFCSHSSRVYKRTQVCYTTTDMERHRLSEYRKISMFLPCKHNWSATRVVSRHFQKSGKLTPNSGKKRE